jgi:hypothetical protein
LLVSRSTSNASAITATGNGTGSGIVATSGSGATGDGIQATAASTNGNGFAITGTGTGNGVKVVSASGDGINSTVSTSGHGMKLTGAGSAKNGLGLQGGTNAAGLSSVGAGTGAGMLLTAGATGAGFSIVAGATSGNGINVAITSGFAINAPGAVVAGLSTGTATAGAADSITLAASEPTTAKLYVGTKVAIVSGTGVGQSRYIISYSTGRVATVARPWAVTPDATSVYVIYADNQVPFLRLDTAQSGTASTIVLDANASATDDLYKGMQIRILAGTGDDQVRYIKSYTGSSKTATIVPNWTTTPDSTSVFGILAISSEVNAAEVNHVSTSSVTTINANLGETQPVNFTGTGASALVKTDMVDIAGSAVGTSTAQIGVNVVNAGGTAWGSGAITPSVFATDSITSTALAASAVTKIQTGLSTLTQADIRTSVGLASANLDTQLSTIAGYIDTEVAAIKTKTDFLPSVTAGSAGGLLIAGSNAATTFASTTITGTFTISDGIVVTRSTSNADAVSFTGNGTGDGLMLASGSGATGDGLKIMANSTNGNGINALGAGSGKGILGTGGSTGTGIQGIGGATSGDGIHGVATTSGHGLRGTAAGTNKHGIAGSGAGTGHGMALFAGSTGNALKLLDSAGTGDGDATLGALTVSGVLTATNGGNAINGVGAVASVTGNVGGNVVGSVGSVTGAVGSVTGSVGSVTGNVGGSVASVVGSVGSVTGNVGGNVVGSVASVSGAVGSVTGNVGGNLVGTIGGLTVNALKDLFDTDSTLTFASAVAGSVVKEIANNSGGGVDVNAIADAVWDEALSGHLAVGSAGATLSATPGAVGPGSTPLTWQVKVGATAISGCKVWVSTDDPFTAGNTVAGTSLTDDDGNVRFLLDSDVVYYGWRDHPRYQFSNPIQFRYNSSQTRWEIWNGTSWVAW